MLPCSCPRGPPPYERENGKEIGRRFSGCYVEVISAYSTDTFVAIVSVEQFLTKPEEGGVGKTVVFKNYGSSCNTKYPVQAARDAQSATKIRVGIVSVDLTFPVNPVNNRPHSGTQLRLSRPVRPRPVRHEKQLARFGL